jgi:hypothetical protein
MNCFCDCITVHGLNYCMFALVIRLGLKTLDSIALPQKAPNSILNRGERLQKAITALGQRGVQSLSFFERFGERRRQKKEK